MNDENVDKNNAMEPSSEGFVPTVEGAIEPSLEQPSDPTVAVPEQPANPAPEQPAEKGTLKEKERGRKFPTWTDFFATAGVFVLSVLLGGVVLMLLSQSTLPASSPQATFVYYLVQMLPTIVYLLWLRRRAGRDSGIHLGVGRVNMPIVLWGVLILLASGVVLEPLLELSTSESYDMVVQTIGRGGWAILSTVVAAPILEEILFRGLILESCRERFGNGVALFVSSLLFGIIHVVPVQVINAFVVGFILGYIYLRTRSLLSVMLLHAINNAVAYLTLIFFGDKTDLTVRALLPQDWLYWTVYAISAVLFLWAMIRLWLSLRDHTEVE